MSNFKLYFAALIIAGCCACTNQEYLQEDEETAIEARIVSPSPETRTAVSGVTDDGGILTKWTAGDELGVFDKWGRHIRFIRKTSGTGTSAQFYPERGYYTPEYAYYPYRSANSGRKPEDCIGNLPSIQERVSGNLIGAYKVGTLEKASGGFFSKTYTMSCRHIVTFIRMIIDTDGTVLKDDVLKTVKVSATRNGEPVNIAGEFHFSAVDGSVVMDGIGTEPVITMDWEDGISLTEPITDYMCMLPVIQAGDVIRIEINTSNHTAVIVTPAKKAFEKDVVYNFPLTLTNFTDRMTIDGEIPGTDTEQPTEPEQPAEPEQPENPEPTVTTGTFTACAFNVDGLPQKISFFTINGNGPGSSGTTTMAGIANNLGWDIIAASEDFEYDSQLVAGLSNYSHGTWRGSVSAAQLTSTADTDGLNFFWRTSTTSATGEKYIQYNDAEGGLTSGANTCIKKGFRHYEVTVDATDNVVIDVYITHMNTYSGSGNTESNAYVKAVLSQLRQLRDYVLTNAKANKRPAIIMGDTNMRYTRHDIKTNFLDFVAAYDNNAGYTVSDPWVEFHRSGVYPQWNSFSLMTRFAFAGDTANDIVCADNQKGEVVDKIWYINVPGAEVQLKATAHQNDVDNFRKSTSSVSYSGVMVEDENGANTSGNTKYTSGQSISYTKDVGYSDHFPVVTTFEWTKTVTAE